MILDEPLGRIGELSRAVIEVKIDTGEVADDDQVQVAIVVDVGERRAVRSSVALGCKAGCGGAVD